MIRFGTLGMIACIALGSASLAACGGSDEGGASSGGVDGEGTGDTDGGIGGDDTDGSTDGDGTGGDGDGDAGGSEAMIWAGTWIVEASYTVNCNHGFGNRQERDRTGTWTVQVTGSNDNLTAVPQPNYEMTGVGTETLLSLSGTFPLESSGSSVAETDPDTVNITFTLDEVLGPDEATGTISGKYDAVHVGEYELSNTALRFSR